MPSRVFAPIEAQVEAEMQAGYAARQSDGVDRYKETVEELTARLQQGGFSSEQIEMEIEIQTGYGEQES